MHHEDYELAERCWQELREGRSKRLTAQQVQEIANQIAKPTNTVRRSSRNNLENTREDAWLAACTLAGEMESHPNADNNWAWEKAIALAGEWFKATE